jgi:hypothetical protein
MKPRISLSPVGASGAVTRAWRTYTLLYDEPRQTDRGILRAYVYKLVIRGERNPDRLTVKALIYLKRQEQRSKVHQTW